MNRLLSNLTGRSFDLLVVGGGIHGACIAREAALRGLSVALVERDDFGGAASANSLKIIHCGLRYLQSLNVRRTRESARECQVFMRIAPHLVQPLPCVMPTWGHGLRSRFALRAALASFRWLVPHVPLDRGTRAWLTSGHVISRNDLVALFPGLAECGPFTGGALWYEGQAYNSERLTLAFIRSAAALGAIAANYAEVTQLIVKDRRVVGATVHDKLENGDYRVFARMVVNASGQWSRSVAAMAGVPLPAKRSLMSKAINVITRSLHPSHALGMPLPPGQTRGSRAPRLLFIAPWRGHSIIGTSYLPANEDCANHATDREVEDLILAVNTTYPAACLRIEDVRFRHGGLLPVRKRTAAGVDALAHRARIIDHQQEHRVAGMVTVRGVKYTTARAVAERVVSTVVDRLHLKNCRANSACLPVDGGVLGQLDEYEHALERTVPPALRPAVPRLVRNYGTRSEDIVAHWRRHPRDARGVAPSTDVTCAEVRYAVRKEMARKLADIVMRRTELGTLGCPPDDVLQGCAEIMAEEAGWSQDRMRREIDQVRQLYAPQPSAVHAARVPG